MIEASINLDKLGHKATGYLRPLSLLLLMAVIFASPSSAADIAIIKSNNINPYNQAIKGFTQAIKTGFKEFNLQTSPEKVFNDIVKEKPKLIFAVGALAATQAKEKFPTTPVVYTLVINPESKNLAGKNMIGVSISSPTSKQITMFKKTVPKTSKIGMLYSNETENIFMKAQKDCRKLGITLIGSKIESPEDVPTHIKSMIGVIDSLWLIPDSMIINQESLRFMLLLTLENKVPCLIYSKSFVKAGALISPVVDYVKVGEQAGRIGESILAGKNISDKIFPPEEVNWAINRHVAENMGLSIPQKVLELFKYQYK